MVSGVVYMFQNSQRSAAGPSSVAYWRSVSGKCVNPVCSPTFCSW